VDGRRKTFEEIEFEYSGCRFTIPEGFECDGSSIPRFFWRVVGSPTTGPNLLAGIMHDFLYSERMFNRKLCDQIFYDALVELGKPKFLAWAMYMAVRWCGDSHY